MRQVASVISTYSSDEFGICSALFELGGMVVMHDASGCNSTYTTHDEPRWYDMDSMIFISAISEMEAIMGDDDKLINDMIETANDLHPEFIAIVGAPIPYMIGTDYDAIAMMTEQATNIPVLPFPANGMNHYTKGVSMALESLTRRFCTKEYEKTKTPSVNIIGATPLDFCVNGSVESIKDWCREHGFSVNCCFSMGDNLEAIKQASKAHVNLVISYGGLAAAKVLLERFGIPYLVGVPFGKKYADLLAGQLKYTAEHGISQVSYTDIRTVNENVKTIGIIGESVFSASLATAISMEHDINVKVLCPLDSEDKLMRSQDEMVPDEDDIVDRLGALDGIIADPLYQPLVKKYTAFYALPHEAFSGRIYDSVNPNLINRKLEI